MSKKTYIFVRKYSHKSKMKTLLALLLLIPSLSWGCLDDLEDYIYSDDMIELVVYSKDKMDLYINNIRNFKAIDIQDYGFTLKMREQFENDYSCPQTSFIDAYNNLGMPVIVDGIPISQHVNKIIIK